MTPPQVPEHKRKARLRKARVRHFLFTNGPNRLTGGRILRRHIERGVMVREVNLASPHWPAAFDGLRIGHVSDFHLGELLPLDKALEVVELLASHEPDFIACTGDVVDLEHHEAPPLLEAMARAGAPLGAALVLGNHDELHCPVTLSRMAEDAGMIVLHNDAVRVGRGGEHLVVAGINWARSPALCSKYVEETCGDETHLLLSHNPKAFVRAADLRVPLTLAGHTHGGQVALRTRPNANLAIAHRWSAGAFDLNGSRLYVTTGVGSWFPLRVNCAAEIAIITMRHGEMEPTGHVID